ncbi:MAG: hypothetical protein PHV78_03120 [Patescibacteria group bacterium]|nr:hypothetical protein [Patescibacteria group bacterium]MDD5121623.1 hypothetical protein [Patescibacteria group bacterium]MDD5221938.1 hypothetical protein [Patescibacteria group bacterium]MDD5396213.1 hypothetical protein [Patescibacteria group bacterium]
MKKVIIIIIIILIIGVIFYYLNWRGKNTANPLIPSNNQTQINEQNNDFTNEGQTDNTPVDPTAKLENDLTVMARAFIEQYGSWSNQSTFSNFTDLYPYMTSSLMAQTQNLVNQKIAEKKLSLSYYGITTKILSLELKNLAEPTGEFFANIQQQETKGDTTTVLYKTVKLVLLKEGSQWKVNDIIFNP